MRQRLKLASEFEYGFSGTVDLDTKWVFNFIMKIFYYLLYLLFYYCLFFKMSDIDVDIDADRDRSILDEILRFRILVPFIGITKTIFKSSDALICSESLL